MGRYGLQQGSLHEAITHCWDVKDAIPRVTKHEPSEVVGAKIAVRKIGRQSGQIFLQTSLEAIDTGGHFPVRKILAQYLIPSAAQSF